MEVLEDKIRKQRLATKAISANDPDALEDCPLRDERLPALKGTLGHWLLERYDKTGNDLDLKDSKANMAQAVALCPSTHIDRAMWSLSLAQVTAKRYRRDGAFNDFEDAIIYFKIALNQTIATTDTRILAGAALVSLYVLEHKWLEAYDTIRTTMSLVPNLIPQSLSNPDKQHILREVTGLASFGAAIAFEANAGPMAALEILVQGRGLFAASIEDLRMDILSLREKHPEMAQRLIEIRTALEKPVPENPLTFGLGPSSNWQGNTSLRYRLGNEFDSLVREVRMLAGFERFLLPPGEEQIQRAAEFGPIVLVNSYEHRCDAIIIQTHGIHAIPLPDLHESEIKTKTLDASLNSPETLEWLWDVVAGPVLDDLGLTESPSDGRYVRLWWVLTGMLSKFPIPAAGYHFEKTARTVMDRAISSYSSSLKSIIDTRQLCHREEIILSETTQALLIAIEHTRGHSKLPFAKEEVDLLRELFGRASIKTIQPEDNKQGILTQLLKCKLFHFAGHGCTDSRDPLRSHLLLSGGRGKDDQLSMRDLLEVNLRQSAPFLAFLSACGTARIRDQKFLDENMHLINACRLAGFRHVIGTLWEVNDEICKDVAAYAYEEMMRSGGITDESVAWGLHAAILAMRKSWMDSTNNNEATREGCDVISLNGISLLSITEESGRDILEVADESTRGRKPALWIPYIHFGV